MIRIVGVGRDGDVAVDENVGVGLSGSTSSLFLGRSFDRNIFFRPARLRFGAEGGIMESLSRIGDKLVCGDNGDGGARVAGKYPGVEGNAKSGGGVSRLDFIFVGPELSEFVRSRSSSPSIMSCRLEFSRRMG